MLFAVNYAAFGLVMILFLMFEPLGLVGIWRRMQSYFLLWPFKHRAGSGTAPMTEPLLAVEKLEVVYQRAITAVQGITLAVAPGRSSRCSAPTAPARPRRCAPSPASSASTTPASPKARISFKGERIENRPPHKITRRGIVLVPERDKVFPNLTVAENLAAPVPRAASAPSAAGAKRWCYQFFPRLGELRDRIGGLLSGGERQMLAIAGALVCRPELLLVDELSLGLAPVVVEDLMRRLSRSGATSASPSCWWSRARRWRSRSPTTATCMENGRIVLDGSAERAAQPSRHPGVLSRPVQRRRTPQLSRRQAVSPQPEVVWLSSRSIALDAAFRRPARCSTACRSRSKPASCSR